MANISIKRQLQSITADFNGTVETGFLYESAGKFYLPLTLDDFSAPDITLTAVAGALNATKLTSAVVGKFDNIREGDIVTSTSVGALTPPADTVRNCYTVKDLKYIVYADTFNASNLNVQAGDAVTGTGIGTNAVVDKIDYPTRRIFLSVASTASAAVDVTFEHPVRVTAVRTSKATANANQVDIDGTVSTAIVNSSVVFTPGAREAVMGVLQLQPVSNSTGSRLSYNAFISILDGTKVIGAANGLNNIDVASLNYVSIGTFGIELDRFLLTARVPSPTSV